MEEQAEIPYWITLAHLPRWRVERINRLIIKIVHENKMSLEAFFNLDIEKWKNDFELLEKEIFDLEEAKKNLPNNSFLAEDLLAQGFEIIPINSPEYSKILKQNLKIKYSPPILYVKGNKQLMHENSVAIVGSRKADAISLTFTDNVAKEATKQYKVVVSGFAKGVDKQALDSSLKYKGQSIIVLPQGILTFKSGIKKYYKSIIDGNVLVVSTFHPKATWSVGLAMARNPIIYGFAKEIYVAQSENKGGTWSGVNDGLKKNRKIFVRFPTDNEKNANIQLIVKGAVPVSITGEIIEKEVKKNVEKQKQVNDEIKIIEEKILMALNFGIFSSKEIIKKTNIEWSTRKVTGFLKTHKEIETIQKKPLHFKKRDNNFVQKNMFAE